jgi:asparagine synthase (glutamine-hydrolysing)
VKNFLTSIDKKTHTLSIIEHYNNMHSLEQEHLSILFTGEKSKLDIAKAYKKKGILFLQELEGSFTCLIHDKLQHKLFIAKDKVGIEPLYFTSIKNQIIVGTHLRTFHKVKDFSAIVNPSAIGEYLQFGFILQPNTIFKKCYKVCSGEYISFDLNKNTYKASNYWKLESCYKTAKTEKTETIILKETDTLLQEAIEKNTKNSAFGLSLSGGYDSATLTAICQQQNEQKIDTFTIGFHDKKINEAPHAKNIAKHLGTRHHEYYFTEQDAIDLIPTMCNVYDEPFADHASTPTMLTSQLLQKKGLSNLIAGDGGDEVFATAEDVHFFNRLQNTPMLLKKLCATSLNSIKMNKLPYFKNLNNLPKKQNKLSQLLLAKSIPQMIYSRNTLFMEKELQTTIKNYTQVIHSSFNNINFYGHAEAVDEVIGSYFKTTMVDGELVKSYSAMNYLDIKLSIPFLNIELIDYMAKVPSKIKIKNNVKKYLLKEIAHTYIPKTLIDRPKSGFDIPFSLWMRKELKDILYSQISKERLDKDNIFYTSSILYIRNQFYAGNDAYKYKLWRIFIFQLWYENFTLTLKNNKG